MSLTVTVKLHVPKFPAASPTVYVTVVIPLLKVCVPTGFMPAAGEAATVAPVIAQVRRVTAQLSANTAAGTVTEAVQSPGSAFWLIFIGHVIVGAMISVTVTFDVHVAELPLPSVTVIMTAFTPRLVQLKSVLLNIIEAMLQLSELPLFTSAAVIEAVPEAFNWIVMSLQIATGGVMSLSVTLKVVLAEFPDGSTAVSVITCTVPAPEITVPGKGFCVTSGLPQLSVIVDDEV